MALSSQSSNQGLWSTARLGRTAAQENRCPQPQQRDSFFEKLNFDCRLRIYDYLDVLRSGGDGGLRGSCRQARVEIDSARKRQLNQMLTSINKKGGLYGYEIRAEIETAPDMTRVIVTVSIDSSSFDKTRCLLSKQSDIAVLCELLSIRVRRVSLRFELGGQAKARIGRWLWRQTCRNIITSRCKYSIPEDFDLAWQGNGEDVSSSPSHRSSARSRMPNISIQASISVNLSTTRSSGIVSFRSTGRSHFQSLLFRLLAQDTMESQ